MNRTANGPSGPRIYLDVVPRDIRSRNTDWRYVRFLLPRLVEWEPALDLVLQTSPWVSLRANYKAIRTAIGWRARLPLPLRQRETDLLDAAELRRSRCKAVFSHRGYPLNVGDTPVIWQSSILDPVMAQSYLPHQAAELQSEAEIRHELFQRATSVQVSTIAEASRLSAMFPGLAGRFAPVPFFLPDLQAASEDLLERHREPEHVELLFVGNDAKRKGLDLLLQAFQQLPASVRNHAHLTVISNFDGVPVEVRTTSEITVLRGVPHAEVLARMRRAHVLINLARFESYGFIFPEAMSQGVACIGPEWEVQRELLDQGRAGINLPCDADALCDALTTLIEDNGSRHQIAKAGWLRFQQHFSAPVVARQYATLFQNIANRG